ncbi:MAG: phage tail tape measure protein, partial [Muribaculaceae bacterium]|nr:phage tail tape measure protein [Muribaculaceae bacterium]
DEKVYGTEQSLLKVGSVINELSQNCSASAPYLAEFASRMGGVGAQAGMTIQQIMGFGAVLDSNEQKVEASATALSQVIVRMLQDPAKYAKVAGLEVQSFSKMLKEDANGALIMFLESLQKAGGMDVLSPMFKDMGENGSRAISALSTLATHIDEVKAQQEAANDAFREGISIDNEFDVQNTTVQAGLEKCANAAHELQVELGEKLQPVLGHLLISSSKILRVALDVGKFLFEHKSAVIALTAAITAYSIVVNLAAIKTKIATSWTAAWTAVSKGAPMVFATFRLAAVAVANSVQFFTNGLQVNIAMQTKWRQAMALFKASALASPIGLLVAALAGLTAWMISLRKKTDEAAKSMHEAMNSANSFAESLKKEQDEIDGMFGKLNALKKGTKEYADAKDAIISRYGPYLQGLVNEKGEIINLTAAYNRLTWAAQRSAQARSINAAREKINDTYFTDINDKTSELRKQLEKMGVPVKEVTEIATKVSQFFGSNGDFQSAEWKSIFSTVKKLQRQHTSGMPWQADALGVLAGMRNNTRERNQSLSQLDEMENRRFKYLDDDNLKKSIDNLTNQMRQSPRSSYDVSLPTGSLENAKIVAQQFGDPSKHRSTSSNEANMPNFSLPKAPEAKQSHNDTGKFYNIKTPEAKSSQPLNPVPTNAGGAFVFHQIPMKNAGIMDAKLSQKEAEKLLRELMFEADQRGLNNNANNQEDEAKAISSGYHSSKDSDKAAKEAAKNAREAAIKAKKEFKDALDQIKAERDKEQTDNIALRMMGEIDYRKYIERKLAADEKYYNDSIALYEQWGIKEDKECQALVRKREEFLNKANEQRLALNKEAIQRIAEAEERDLKARYDYKSSHTLAEELRLEEEILTIRYNSLMDQQALYKKTDKEYEEYQRRIDELFLNDQESKQKKILKKIEEFRKEFDYQPVKLKYDMERAALDELYMREKIEEEEYRKWLKKLNDKEAEEEKKQKESLPGMQKPANPTTNAAEANKKFDDRKKELDEALADGRISEEEYSAALRRIDAELRKSLIAPIKESKSEWVSMLTSMYDAWADFAVALNDPDGNPFMAMGAAIEATATMAMALMSTVTEFQKAEFEIQEAQIKKRYAAEIDAAQGNSYRVRRLEKEQEQELANMKNEQSRKQFAMQVIAAVAQTATNALAAYGSAAAIPVVGHVLAPIAAAMAVAQGAVQVALLKKQQQAAAAQGYSKGGFTKPGAVDEPAGIVHAGEWVASQKLLANPVARPMIEALDYAQRTNTIGSIKDEDVSRSIRAADSMVRIAESNDSSALMIAAIAHNAETMASLNERLKYPIDAAVSIAGEHGVAHAEDRYHMYLRNKSPKNF